MKNTEVATAQVLSRRVNGVAVGDLATVVGSIKAAPAIAMFKFRVRNQWLGGSRNNSTVDSYYGVGQEFSRQQPFVLESDEPPVLLGTDMAAGAGEYLLHALATCLTTTIVYHAAARGIEIEEIESSLEGDVDLQGFLDLDKKVRQGFQGIRVNFKIKADVSDEQLLEIWQLGPMHSPVFDSLTKGVPITVTGERL